MATDDPPEMLKKRKNRNGMDVAGACSINEDRMPDHRNATPEEVAVLVRMAGLTLTENQFEDLLDAYSHVEAMLARLRAPRPFGDEPAHVFIPDRFA